MLTMLPTALMACVKAGGKATAETVPMFATIWKFEMRIAEDCLNRGHASRVTGTQSEMQWSSLSRDFAKYP